MKLLIYLIETTECKHDILLKKNMDYMLLKTNVEIYKCLVFFIQIKNFNKK